MNLWVKKVEPMFGGGAGGGDEGGGVGGDCRDGQGARFGMKVSGQEGWEGTGCGWWSISSSFLRIPER